jgi:CTP:molybdopterin cytidylyltransferase MocA
LIELARNAFVRNPESMSRIFAIVPAAGHSRRMGSPKLLLDLAGKSVLARLLETLGGDDRITETILVARSGDARLIAEAERCGATVLRPEADPREMRDSVELALADVAARHRPADDDAWALIPADYPLIRPETLARILDCWNDYGEDILIPTSNGRGGHPTLFRWSLAAEVAGIPENCGLNRLFERHAQRVRRQEFGAAELLFDLDTPADVDRALRRMGEEPDTRD